MDGVFEVGWHEARGIAAAAASPAATESVPVADAHGRVLASDVTALSHMPPFAASRIDGWAVSGPGPWLVVGDSRAGDLPTTMLAPGQCAHIATGAQLPDGATACLKDEESELREGRVSPIGGAVGILTDSGCLPEGHDVRPRGYEAAAGEVLVPAGTTLTPGAVGVIAGAGHDVIDVFQRITIDVLVFGDELLDTGPSRDGKVRDSLGPQLPGWISHIGARVLATTRVEDTLESHVAAISSSTADLIITTGGTAAGPVDYLHQAIADCGGTLLVDAVLVRPGYHQLLASLPGRHLIGLPGNPQSAVIGLLTLADALVRGSYGLPPRPLERRIVARDISAPGREVRLAMCRVTDRGVEPVAHVDSSMLRGFVEADGYAVIPPGGIAAGGKVEWLPLP